MSTEKGPKVTGKIRYERRVSLLFLLLIGICLLFVVRLVDLQVFESDSYRSMIAEDRRVTTRLRARRGNIVDRNGLPLATTVETYDLSVLPAHFRESNSIDALGDLLLAWVPDGATLQDIGDGLVDRAAARAERLLMLHDQRAEMVSRLFECPPDQRCGEVSQLRTRMKSVLAPQGELLLTAGQLPSRLRRSLVLLGRFPDGNGAARVHKGLEEGWPLRRILRQGPDDVARIIENELKQLSQLAELADMESVQAILSAIATCEIEEARSIEARIVALLDDHIALERIGTFNLEEDLSEEELNELARSLDVPLEDPERLTQGVAKLRGESEALAQRRSQVNEILAGRTVGQLEVFERRALARVLELFDARPDVLKRRLGQRERLGPEFLRSQFLSSRKERLRRTEFKNWSPRRLATGCSFEVAQSVWNLYGPAQLGFRVAPRYGRTYWRDQDGVAALLVGRVSRSSVALNGLEQSLEHELSDLADGVPSIEGEDGVAILERQFDGRLKEKALKKAPVQGSQITLTLDRDLQSDVEDVLIQMLRELAPKSALAGGGACILDIETGEILALASVPRVPGDRFVRELENERGLRLSKRAVETAFASGRIEPSVRRAELASLKALLERRVLVDRASNVGEHGYYPPGSVMKAFSSLCILKDEVLDPEREFICSTRKYHGPVALHSALVQSCNAYFWTASREIGVKRLVESFENWGLFQTVPLLLSQASGRNRRRAIQGDSAQNLIIGQGSLSTSPLEVANMMSNLGRFGERLVPRIVRAVAGRRLPVERLEPVDISRAHVLRVLKAMRGVYEKYERRDARLMPLSSYGICGKTGTAEGYVGAHADDNIAWFAGVAPFDRPKIAFAVFAEHTQKTGRHVIPYAGQLVRLAQERSVR